MLIITRTAFCSGSYAGRRLNTLQTYSKGQKISIALVNLLFLRLFKVSAPRSSKFHIEDAFVLKLLKKHMIFQRSVFPRESVRSIHLSMY
jgi:hypothetical protein